MLRRPRARDGTPYIIDIFLVVIVTQCTLLMYLGTVTHNVKGTITAKVLGTDFVLFLVSFKLLSLV